MSAIETPAETFARLGFAYVGEHMINTSSAGIDVYEDIEGDWCRIGTVANIADALTLITKEQTA
jgi:hypothetical protein